MDSPTNAPIQDVVAGRIPIFADRSQWDRDREEIERDITRLGETLRAALDSAESMDKLKRGLREAQGSLSMPAVAAPAADPAAVKDVPVAPIPAPARSPGESAPALDVERLAESFTRALVRFEQIKAHTTDKVQDETATLLAMIARLLGDVKDQVTLIRTELVRARGK